MRQMSRSEPSTCEESWSSPPFLWLTGVLRHERPFRAEKPAVVPHLPETVRIRWAALPESHHAETLNVKEKGDEGVLIGPWFSEVLRELDGASQR